GRLVAIQSSPSPGQILAPRSIAGRRPCARWSWEARGRIRHIWSSTPIGIDRSTKARRVRRAPLRWRNIAGVSTIWRWINRILAWSWGWRTDVWIRTKKRPVCVLEIPTYTRTQVPVPYWRWSAERATADDESTKASRRLWLWVCRLHLAIRRRV